MVHEIEVQLEYITPLEKTSLVWEDRIEMVGEEKRNGWVTSF
jgi:hypothetical protein